MLLQQHLPFTVLKLAPNVTIAVANTKLQQHLPFTVLKLKPDTNTDSMKSAVATTPTVYGIETLY